MNRSINPTPDSPFVREVYFPDEEYLPKRRAVALFLAKGLTWLLIGFLAISTFEGALRFYAARAGMPWLVYSKDVLLIGALALGLVHTFITDVRNLPLFVILGLLVVGSIVGISNLPDVRQPLFAAKTWLPLLCGAAIATALDFDKRTLRRACGVLWFFALGGIFLTAVWNAPWIGFVYDVGGVSLEGSREWTIGESSRVPGFSRASFDAALQVLFFGTIVVVTTRYYIIGFCVWLVSAAAIYLTLSRSALVAVAVAIGIHFLVYTLKATQRLAKIAVILLAVAVVALPFAAGKYYKDRAGMADSTTVASTSSFEERAVKTWPDGLALINRGGNVVTGRGLGGIGVSQQLFENDIFSPGDNFFVYMWSAFGLLGLAFIALIPIQAWRSKVPLDRRGQAAVISLGAFLAVGLTLNGIEAAIPSLFLGMALVWLTARRVSA